MEGGGSGRRNEPARPDHAFGQRAQLLEERLRSGRDTRDGPDRFAPPSLAGDGDVVLESPGHHEEARTVRERLGQDRLRVANGRVERDRAHGSEPGSPGSLFYPAPDARTERAAPGVEDRGPTRCSRHRGRRGGSRRTRLAPGGAAGRSARPRLRRRRVRVRSVRPLGCLSSAQVGACAEDNVKLDRDSGAD
jgi:hypothetical protein